MRIPMIQEKGRGQRIRDRETQRWSNVPRTVAKRIQRKEGL